MEIYIYSIYCIVSFPLKRAIATISTSQSTPLVLHFQIVVHKKFPISHLNGISSMAAALNAALHRSVFRGLHCQQPSNEEVSRAFTDANSCTGNEHFQVLPILRDKDQARWPLKSAFMHPTKS